MPGVGNMVSEGPSNYLGSFNSENCQKRIKFLMSLNAVICKKVQNSIFVMSTDNTNVYF